MTYKTVYDLKAYEKKSGVSYLYRTSRKKRILRELAATDWDRFLSTDCKIPSGLQTVKLRQGYLVHLTFAVQSECFWIAPNTKNSFVLALVLTFCHWAESHWGYLNMRNKFSRCLQFILLETTTIRAPGMDFTNSKSANLVWHFWCKSAGFTRVYWHLKVARNIWPRSFQDSIEFCLPSSTLKAFGNFSLVSTNL